MLGHVLGMVLSEVQAEEVCLTLYLHGAFSLGRDGPADAWPDTESGFGPTRK